MNGTEQKAEIDLTPTEGLVMEVLAARHRLGEHLWTFDSRLNRAIESLADKGLVMPMSGQVERTVRAALTQEGLSAYVSDRYVPPILREVGGMLNRALDAGDRFGRYSEQWADAIHDLRARLTRPEASADR